MRTTTCVHRMSIRYGTLKRHQLCSGLKPTHALYTVEFKKPWTQAQEGLASTIEWAIVVNVEIRLRFESSKEDLQEPTTRLIKLFGTIYQGSAWCATGSKHRRKSCRRKRISLPLYVFHVVLMSVTERRNRAQVACAVFGSDGSTLNEYVSPKFAAMTQAMTLWHVCAVLKRRQAPQRTAG